MPVPLKQWLGKAKASLGSGLTVHKSVSSPSGTTEWSSQAAPRKGEYHSPGAPLPSRRTRRPKILTWWRGCGVTAGIAQAPHRPSASLEDTRCSPTVGDPSKVGEHILSSKLYLSVKVGEESHQLTIMTWSKSGTGSKLQELPICCQFSREVREALI